MKQKERREQQRDELRAKILDAARELFVGDGVERVSMRKIADKIGYTATTLYNHFPDKEAVLHALCEADFLALRGAFERIARINDPIERLRKLGQAYVEFGLQHPSHYQFMFMTPRVHDMEMESDQFRKGNPDQDAYAFLRATVAAGIEAGLFRDEYRDPDLVAQIVWSGVHGVVALHLIISKDHWLNWRPVETIARSVSDVMLTGLLRPKNQRG